MSKCKALKIISFAVLVVSSYSLRTQASVQSCIDASTVCSLPPGYTETLTQTLHFHKDGQTLQCHGAVLTLGADQMMVRIDAPHVTVSDCVFDAAHASVKSTLLGGRPQHLVLSGNTFKNSNSTLIWVSQSDDVQIVKNHFSASRSDAIFAERNVTHFVIADNDIDASSTEVWHHAIAFHSTAPGQIASNITIKNNTIKNGSSFCVEVGSFGGLPPTDILVQNNHCTQVPSQIHFGGYSFDTVIGAQVLNNVYENTTGMPSGLGIELVSGTRALAQGNTVTGAAISINKQTYTDFSSNTLNLSRIYIGTSVAEKDNDHDSIHDNTLTFNGMTSRGLLKSAIWIQCNAAKTDCSETRIEHNRISGTGGGAAIKIENDAPNGHGADTRPAVVNHPMILNNTFSNWSRCIDAKPAIKATMEASGNTGCSEPGM